MILDDNTPAPAAIAAPFPVLIVFSGMGQREFCWVAPSEAQHRLAQNGEFGIGVRRATREEVLANPAPAAS